MKNVMLFWFKNDKVVYGSIAQYSLVDNLSSVLDEYNPSEAFRGSAKGHYRETILNTMDEVVSEFEYKDGKVIASSCLQSRQKNPQNDLGTERNRCIDWYWVTTWSDGSTTWQYLYTTCSDDCEQTKIIGSKAFGRCPGGGGGNSTDHGEADVTQYESETVEEDALFDPSSAVGSGNAPITYSNHISWTYSRNTHQFLSVNTTPIVPYPGNLQYTDKWGRRVVRTVACYNQQPHSWWQISSNEAWVTKDCNAIIVYIYTNGTPTYTRTKGVHLSQTIVN